MAEKEPVQDGRDRIITMLTNVEDDILATIRAVSGDERWKAVAVTQIELGFMCVKRALYDGKRVGD